MYRPKIQKEQLEQIYLLAKKFDVPVTIVIKVIIQEYFDKHKELTKAETNKLIK